MNEAENILQTEALDIGYHGRNRRTLVARQLDLRLQRGELVGLLGPNGSGKSTLIRTLAHMQKPLAGRVLLEGSNLSELTVKQVARKVSTVLTDRIRVGNLTVYSLIAFGRSPYTGMMGRLREEDRKVVEWAIKAAGLTDFVDRDIQKLSDGERQKVMIARALAQDTPVILLDEPTAHLDLPNRVEIIRLLRKLAHETNKAILMSTHELDLALKACDQVWLMNRGTELLAGTPEDLVLNGTFEEVFRRDSFEFDRATGSFNIHQHRNRSITLEGDEIPKYWTARALKREGYKVVEKGGDAEIVAGQQGDQFYWRVREGQEYRSIQELVQYLRKQH